MKKRQELIRQIEELRNSRVIAYVTSDRQPAFGGQIGDDAVRQFFTHLREFGQVQKLDLFLYSRGGAIDVPWRLVIALRRCAKSWGVLVPFRANSAATLIALGADQIVFGRYGELGPIDPIMNFQHKGQQRQVSVEDIMSYLKFATEKAGLSDQTALSGSLSKLAEGLDPTFLGNAYRTHSHIRDVARRILLSRKTPPSEQALETIIESLAERVYAHGHAIGLADAKALGLPAEAASAELDEAMWNLLGGYERRTKMLDILDPNAVTEGKEEHDEEGVTALIESTIGAHEFAGRIKVKKKRKVPQSLNLSLNLNLQLPPALAQQLAQGQMQQAVQQLNAAVAQQAQQAVKDAMISQSPVEGFEMSLVGGNWRFVTLPEEPQTGQGKARSNAEERPGSGDPPDPGVGQDPSQVQEPTEKRNAQDQKS